MSEAVTPERLDELKRLHAANEARMAFLRFQARLPLRVLLLCTTAIMTGVVR